MSPMTEKTPLKAVSRENIPPAEPLSVVSICLDRDTWGTLKLFTDAARFVKLERHLTEYRVSDHESVLEWIGTPAPDICMLDFDLDRRSAAMVAERIHADSPDTAIFAVSSEAQPDLIIQAMRSGCSEYLVKPLDSDQLLNAVARVGGRRKEKNQQAKAQVLVFIGAKGGCGVTSIVTQLGALLSQSLSRKTLAVDLHPDFGDAALYLGLTKYRYHSYELIENTDRLDAELLQSFVLRHSSGLDLIPAPQGTEPARSFASGALVQTFEFLRLGYEFILVDLPQGLNDEYLELIRGCDQINVVTVAEVSALRNVVRQTDYFVRNGIPAERVRVILNRHQGRGVITEEQIEKVIGQKISWKVPNQYFQVLKSISGGNPLGQASSSDVGKSLQEWAGAIGKKPNSPDEKKGRGILGLWGR
jgi:pilus assembly protein CpaE